MSYLRDKENECGKRKSQALKPDTKGGGASLIGYRGASLLTVSQALFEWISIDARLCVSFASLWRLS